VVVGIGAAAMAYFLTGKDYGYHVQTLNKTAAFCWWQVALEANTPLYSIVNPLCNKFIVCCVWSWELVGCVLLCVIDLFMYVGAIYCSLF
jgi:hypothetical protein